VIAAVRRWWRRRQRAADLRILWPACVAQAPAIEYARAAFAIHALHDPAWSDYTAAEILDFVKGLHG
jgi:hypothetical protein